MGQVPAAVSKIPTTGTRQAGRAPETASQARRAARSRQADRGWQRARRDPGGGEVITLECGITVDPARLEGGRALAAGNRGDRHELMVNTAAYSGLRWGELTALTVAHVHRSSRVISVDRKVVEVAGHPFVEAPKNRKHRRTVYPVRTPAATRSPSGSPRASRKPPPSSRAGVTRSG